MIPGQTVTITIPRRQERTPFKVGEKVRLGPKSFMRRLKRIKTREMVARMKGKKFHPTFIVTYAQSDNPLQFNAHLKPYNF